MKDYLWGTSPVPFCLVSRSNRDAMKDYLWGTSSVPFYLVSRSNRVLNGAELLPAVGWHVHSTDEAMLLPGANNEVYGTIGKRYQPA
eukprot:1868402-Rhodomonas_salina.7